MRNGHECQTYLEHLKLEHEHLNKLLREISQQFAELAPQPESFVRASEVVAKIGSLREELRSHFDEEEEGGCLEEAVSRCPSMSCDADAVLREHPALREQLEEILAKLRPGGHGRVNWPEVATDFASFAKRLRIHESAENRILQHGFGAAATDADLEE